MARVILALSERQAWIEELEAQLRPEACQVHLELPGSQAPGLLVPDLILVDAPGPAQDVLLICQALRQVHSAPLLLLTTVGSDGVIAAALEAGADCCLPASVSAREAAAWMQALLRRRAMPGPVRAVRFILGSATINLAHGRVQRRGAEVQLPRTQLLLLRALAERPGRVVPREQLLTLALGAQPRRKMSTLHVHMFLLRSLIEEDPRRPRFLKTVRGVGYVLAGELKEVKDGLDWSAQEE